MLTKSWLLSSASYASVADNADSESCSQTCETNRQTSTELYEAGEKRQLLLKTVRYQHGDDETVDTDDTSHNDRYDVCCMSQ